MTRDCALEGQKAGRNRPIKEKWHHQIHCQFGGKVTKIKNQKQKIVSAEMAASFYYTTYSHNNRAQSHKSSQCIMAWKAMWNVAFSPGSMDVIKVQGEAVLLNAALVIWTWVGVCDVVESCLLPWFYGRLLRCFRQEWRNFVLVLTWCSLEKCHCSYVRAGALICKPHKSC